MCAVLLPPGVNPIAVNKYISYHIKATKCPIINIIIIIIIVLYRYSQYLGFKELYFSYE